MQNLNNVTIPFKQTAALVQYLPSFIFLSQYYFKDAGMPVMCRISHRKLEQEIRLLYPPQRQTFSKCVMQANQGAPQVFKIFSEAFHQAQLRAENGPMLHTATGAVRG